MAGKYFKPPPVATKNSLIHILMNFNNHCFLAQCPHIKHLACIANEPTTDQARPKICPVELTCIIISDDDPTITGGVMLFHLIGGVLFLWCLGRHGCFVGGGQKKGKYVVVWEREKKTHHSYLSKET